jgi:hypothetical protein
VSYPRYPAYAKEATSFIDLFLAYSLEWPEPTRQWVHDDSFDSRAYAGHLLGIALRVAQEFPRVDLWEHVEPVLKHSMNWYDPKKGPFTKLFESTLRERLKKAVARLALATRRRRGYERRGAEEARRRRAERDDVADAYHRWRIYLLDLAMERLDRRTRLYVEMRRVGASVKQTAAALGVTEKTLWNKYGGDKDAEMVGREVRALVLELPPDRRQLLVRHLLDEVGLSKAQVQRLLCGATVADEPAARVLEEPDLLEALGWRPKDFSGGFGEVGEYVF